MILSTRAFISSSASSIGPSFAALGGFCNTLDTEHMFANLVCMDDHRPSGVMSEPGQCWRLVYDGEGSGRPTSCPEPVVWVGRFKLLGRNGKWIPVWSCDGHREGVTAAKAVHRLTV